MNESRRVRVQRIPGFGVRRLSQNEDEELEHEQGENKELKDVAHEEARIQTKVHSIPSAIMLSIKQLEHKDWASLRSEWKTWKFTLMIATNSQNFTEGAKMSLLIMRGGPLIQELAMDGPAVLGEERIGEENAPLFSNLIKRIEARITQAANANHDMARLSEATQLEKESIETFARRLRELSKLCNMDENSAEMMIRNRLFDGARYGTRLLELSLPIASMTSQEIVNMGTRLEERDRAKAIKKVEEAQTKSEQEETLVATIGRARGGRRNETFKQEHAPQNSHWKSQHFSHDRRQSFSPQNHQFHSRQGQGQRFSPYGQGRQSSRPKAICDRCGTDCRLKRQCFAKDATCYNCGKQGHLARMCRSSSKTQNHEYRRDSPEADRKLNRLNELPDNESNKVEEETESN